MSELTRAGSQQEQSLCERIQALEYLLAASDKRLEEERLLNEELRATISERFDEIAKLTQLVQKYERMSRSLESRCSWLERVVGMVMRGGRVAAVLPLWVSRVALLKRLKEEGLFDDERYRRANTDIFEHGFRALRHYVRFGLAEGRQRE